MITSTTELLNEISSRPTVASVGNTLKSKQSHPSLFVQKQRKEFALHYACMQSWFLRCSWLEKLNTLTQMLQGLNTIDSLSLILNTLSCTSSKTTVYAECQYSTNFVYDKTLNDQNRSMQKKAFIASRQADMKWFDALEEDYEQVLIIIGLLRLGGGSVMHHIFKKGRELYEMKMLKALEMPKHKSLIEIKTPSIEVMASRCNLQMWPDSQMPDLDQTQPPWLTDYRSLNIKPTNLEELQKRDPKDPFVIEVDKRRKAWNEIIRKYRIQVEGKPPATTKIGKSKGDGKSTKGSKKSEKQSKSEKSSKSGKSSKGDKKKGKGEGEELDQIQLLPIWIVKKIFSYLDTKTLKKVKTVNKYWTYAITDLQKEQKARKYLDKFISKMEAGIPKIETQTYPNEKSQMVKETRDNILNPKKRLQKLWERGAIDPKLKVALKKPIFEKCLATEIAKRAPENYFLPVKLMECFPRSWPKHAAPLYKVHSCQVNELGFTMIDNEDDLLASDDSSELNDIDDHCTQIEEFSEEFISSTSFSSRSGSY